ncbi:MAG: carboxymuconolactone decarboxylase family protein [Betaproteobacteria bacterium]|nr:carboxymuconolactone decarboxylase family protein [Betaproteobacteria bacterium]
MDADLKPMFERGLAVRKQVLGEDYVNQALEGADDFSRPLQEYLTAHAWAASWAREGLTHKQRSMLNLAMLTALNRGHELKIHIGGALNNGVTKEEIREIFIHAAVYCGAPAAMESFRIAREVFAERGI